MAKYIDAGALVRAIKLCANRTSLGQICPPDLSYIEMLGIIADAPTADVAPRAEVDRLRFNLKAVLDERAVDKAEVAREIFEELRRYIINHCYLADDDVDAIWKHIEKLEKKYKEVDQ